MEQNAPARREAADMASSEELFSRARRVIPGGVNSPVRAFRGVGGVPRFIAGAEGAMLTDVDGRSYIDYVMSWGPLILGHRHPAVTEAAAEALRRGSSYGAPTAAEVELAEVIAAAVPGVEMVRCVSSGTEATMTAIRLARAATGRDRIVKFAGHYHGHADALLAAAGSGVATLGLPDSPGVTARGAADTIVAEWNDPEGISAVFEDAGGQIAAVICEPVAANMGVVPAQDGFLELLRDLTARHGALLIADEVLTGFRVALAGAAARRGIAPDLITLGKVVGAGFPLAALGGPADLMRRLAPEGAVYQAGTLSGNPVAVAAGLAQLRLLGDDVYARLEELADRLIAGFGKAFARAGVPAVIQREASLFSVFFAEDPVRGYPDAKQADHERYAQFFHGMLERGVYLPPSGYEALFLSAAHSAEHIDATIAAAEEVAAGL
ncbi:MAG TPA: glutamate-1-semialdehyde 2,1-aminomutase [Egibacteraceae bacterium]|nr:glutamate-1-semialdehyde 2,1-aminomutase [Egibacteraceae bacterium]